MRSFIAKCQNVFFVGGLSLGVVAVLGVLTHLLLQLAGVLNASPWGGWAILMLSAVWCLVFFGLSLLAAAWLNHRDR